MSDTEKVTAYILKHSQWSQQLAQLRRIFQRTELKDKYKKS